VKSSVIAKGKRWRKIEAPLPWKPDEGDELIGRFGGVYTREGAYGTYKVLMVTNEEGSFYVSGTVLISLVEAAGVITPEQHIRVVFKGNQETEIGFIKLFDLYVS
jgi:hypothetical protein